MKNALYLTIAAVLSVGHGPPLLGTAYAAETLSHQQPIGPPLSLLDAAKRMGGSATAAPLPRPAFGASDRSGLSGKAVAQRHVGLISVEGPSGIRNEWMPYQRFRFEPGGADIRASDMRQAADIASYMKANPTARLGLDGSSPMQGSDTPSQTLGERRISIVRAALIQAGIASDKIQIGAFGDAKFQRDNQIEVLLITAR